MADIKKQIIDWFHGPQDFKSGLQLLKQVTKKDRLFDKLEHRGDTKSTFDKLVWELNKIAGLSHIPERKLSGAKKKSGSQEFIPKAGQKESEETGVKSQGQTVKAKEGSSKKIKEPDSPEKVSLVKGKDLLSYPKEVQRLVGEYSSLYMNRGKLHRELKKVGDSNDEESVARRKEVISMIGQDSDRMEMLFAQFDAWEKNKVPIDVKKLWPDPVDKKLPGIDPDLSIEQLKIMKKNLQSSLTKDRNILTFSGKTKPENGKEQPLPGGPKRIIIEKRIAAKEKEIYDIDMRIAELS